MAAPEVENGDLPNEATHVGRTRSKRIHVGSCIKVNGLKYEVVETNDGNILMSPWEEASPPPVLGVVGAPEMGV
jgi:hypothetical protein